MKIHIPNSAFLGNINSFLKGFSPENPKTLEISANKKWISMHPVVLAMIATLGQLVDPKNIKCERIEATSKNYPERMGLFKFLKIESGINIVEHESAGRFIPLTQIKNSNELTKFITEMVPLLHLEPKHAEPIKYIVSELVRNVLEHAKSPCGAILAAQYHKKNNCIRIGIVDAGVGIKATIDRSYPTDTDLKAIKLALMPGITGTTASLGGTEQNAGAGLFFIKSIAKVNRNNFMIYSGHAMYKLLKVPLKSKIKRLFADPFKDHHSKGEDFPYWRGTIVGIDISLDQTEEFSLLLDLIRKTYINTIRERKEAGFKQPKFI